MILNPLAQVLIFAFVLSAVMSAKLPGIDNHYAYAIYLMSGTLGWSLFSEIINRSVNETLSRTIMTSMTVAITLLVLFFFGGEVIHDFSFAMLWGVFVGSYSSIFVAAPIIYQWQARSRPTASSANVRR